MRVLLSGSSSWRQSERERGPLRARSSRNPSGGVPRESRFSPPRTSSRKASLGVLPRMKLTPFELHRAVSTIDVAELGPQMAATSNHVRIPSSGRAASRSRPRFGHAPGISWSLISAAHATTIYRRFANSWPKHGRPCVGTERRSFASRKWSWMMPSSRVLGSRPGERDGVPNQVLRGLVRAFIGRSRAGEACPTADYGASSSRSSNPGSAPGSGELKSVGCSEPSLGGRRGATAPAEPSLAHGLPSEPESKMIPASLGPEALPRSKSCAMRSGDWATTLICSRRTRSGTHSAPESSNRKLKVRWCFATSLRQQPTLRTGSRKSARMLCSSLKAQGSLRSRSVPGSCSSVEMSSFLASTCATREWPHYDLPRSQRRAHILDGRVSIGRAPIPP